jgi:hypothetical protein
MLSPLLFDDGQINDGRCRRLEFFDRKIVDSSAVATGQDRASLPAYFRSFLAIDIPEWSFQRLAMQASPQHLDLQADLLVRSSHGRPGRIYDRDQEWHDRDQHHHGEDGKRSDVFQ